MKTLITLFILAFLCNDQIKAQKTTDIIYRKNGDSLICTITKIDSSSIYFTTTIRHKKVKTFIAHNDVRDYKSIINRKKSKPGNPYLGLNRFCLTSDPFGLLTLGPLTTGELLLQYPGKNIGLGVYTGVRLTNFGFLSYLLFNAGAMNLSYTIPLGIKIYPRTRYKADGFLIGPHVEYGKSKFYNGQVCRVRAFGAQIGYKQVFHSSFTLELSYFIGLVQTNFDDYIETVIIKGPYGTITQTNRIEGVGWETVLIARNLLSVKLGKTF